MRASAHEATKLIGRKRDWEAQTSFELQAACNKCSSRGHYAGHYSRGPFAIESNTLYMGPIEGTHVQNPRYSSSFFRKPGYESWHRKW